MTKQLQNTRHPQTPKKEYLKTNANSHKNSPKNTPVTPSQIHNPNQLISPMNLNMQRKNREKGHYAKLRFMKTKLEHCITKDGARQIKKHIMQCQQQNDKEECQYELAFIGESRKEALQEKSKGSVSIDCQDGNTSSFAMLNQGQRKSQGQLEFPFDEYRKSYRKLGWRRSLEFIPFRKNQDPVQRKIISVINKLLHQKFCQKQMLGLAEKMLKLDSKQLLNRYLISGFQTILRLVQAFKARDFEEPSQFSLQEMLRRLREVRNKVQIMIEDQLDCCEEFQNCFARPEVNAKQIKSFLVRKIYRILKRIKGNQQSDKLKDRAIKISDTFILNDRIQYNSVMRLLQRLQNEKSQKAEQLTQMWKI